MFKFTNSILVTGKLISLNLSSEKEKIRLINSFKVNGPGLSGCSASSATFNMPAPAYKATIKTDFVGKADDGVTTYINSQFLYTLTSSNKDTGFMVVYSILTGVPSGTVTITDLKETGNVLSFQPYNGAGVCEMAVNYSVSTITWWTE